MTKNEMVSYYNEYFEMVWRICFVQLNGNREDTEDCVSETFLKLYRSYNGDSADSGHVKAWLIVTAQNTCRSLLKRAYRKNTSLEQHIELYGESEAEEKDPRLWEALSMLSDNERSAVCLYYIFGYSGEETAKLMSAKKPTVYSWLNRARKRLEKLLKGGEDL